MTDQPPPPAAADDPSAAEPHESQPAAGPHFNPAENDAPFSTPSLRDASRELAAFGLAAQAAMQPLLFGLQNSVALLTTLRDKLTGQEKSSSEKPDNHDAAFPAGAGWQPAVSPVGNRQNADLAGEAFEGSTVSSASVPGESPGVSLPNPEAGHDALAQALTELSRLTQANTQKLINQVRAAMAQQQQLQSQIDALRSAQQQQAGQNANRNLNTGN